MRGKGRRWSGHDSGPVSVFSRRGEVTVWGRWVGRDGGERTRREVLADRTGASLRGRSVGRMAGQLRTSGWEWNRSQPCQGATPKASAEAG